MKRIDILKRVPAAHYFISFEPLLGALDKYDLHSKLEGINWAIVGGESGELHRPFKHAWADDIREMCERRDIPFFFKQGGGIYPGQDRVLQTTGMMYEQEPAAFAAHRAKYQTVNSQPSLF